jgi:tetratricopeptide (TPR) repeat protein
MPTRASRSAVLATLLAALLASPSVLAQDTPATKSNKTEKTERRGKSGDKSDKGDKADKYDPDNIKGISRYVEQINNGAAKYLARDFAGALEVFRATIPLAPKNPLGHYASAEALIAADNLAEAEASLKQAESLSDDKNAALRAKIIFLTADVKERQKKWEDARAAWQTYADYAQKHTDVAFVQSGTSRMQAIDDMLKQDKAYEAVRQRIQAEKQNPPTAASTTPATPPPKK